MFAKAVKYINSSIVKKQTMGVAGLPESIPHGPRMEATVSRFLAYGTVV